MNSGQKKCQLTVDTSCGYWDVSFVFYLLKDSITEVQRLQTFWTTNVSQYLICISVQIFQTELRVMDGGAHITITSDCKLVLKSRTARTWILPVSLRCCFKLQMWWKIWWVVEVLYVAHVHTNLTRDLFCSDVRQCCISAAVSPYSCNVTEILIFTKCVVQAEDEWRASCLSW